MRSDVGGSDDAAVVSVDRNGDGSEAFLGFEIDQGIAFAAIRNNRGNDEDLSVIVSGVCGFSVMPLMVEVTSSFESRPSRMRPTEVQKAGSR